MGVVKTLTSVVNALTGVLSVKMLSQGAWARGDTCGGERVIIFTTYVSVFTTPVSEFTSPVSI